MCCVMPVSAVTMTMRNVRRDISALQEDMQTAAGKLNVEALTVSVRSDTPRGMAFAIPFDMR